MYVLTDKNYYLGKDFKGRPMAVFSKDKAMTFTTSLAASNCSKNLPASLRGYLWQVVDIDNNLSDGSNIACSLRVVDTSRSTQIEDDNFDICSFFTDVINVMSQIDRFIANMQYKEETVDMKILDIRHYIRDNNHKLNAVQMQRLGYYLQELEIERYDYKSKRIIASLFSENINALKDLNSINKIQDVLTSQYRPKVLSDTDIEFIINKKKEAV
ncbi:MAG: hypothetical protein IJC69_02650 [Clostridia bacterium]|nr:hypothetical protein [Clostridia bacterium]